MMFIRGIIQAYVQSVTKLNRIIIARLPREIAHLYPPSTIVLVTKLLYGVPEAGTHWWATNYNHHRDKLKMKASTFDPCLLITTEESGCFGILGVQTDDTLSLGDKALLEREDTELRNAGFAAKPRRVLSPETSHSVQRVYSEGVRGWNH